MIKIPTICMMLLLIGIVPNRGEAQFKNLFKKAKSEILGNEEQEIGLGLKEALSLGTKEAVSKLSADNGYFESPYKIVLPEEAEKVVSKVKIVPGFDNVEANLIQKMNQAAEIAAKKATPIFLETIANLSFKDVMNILMGENNAATTYLENNTREKLYSEFMPVIQNALDEVNARTYWTTVVEAYNKIPFTKDVNPHLDDHVNGKALEGMFGYIEVKEEGIRNDLGQRDSPLLRKVFAKQDSKEK